MRLSLDVVEDKNVKKRLVQIFLTLILEDELDSFKETMSKPNVLFYKKVFN
jgi:hypothetical protein